LVIFSTLLILAGVMDSQQASVGNNGVTPTSSAEEELLQPCAASQGSYSGPLVPNQDTPSPVVESDEILPEGAIEPSDWSARAGFSISYATDPTYWAQVLGSGWYLDWNVRDELPAGSPEHWQMVRVHEDCISPSPEAIRRSAARQPGQVWIIGNEPDVIWQDDVTPQRYALVYHALYQLIRSSDPTALIAVGGISQATPLRLQYLDQVLAAYQERYHEALPADWWTVHGYVLREQKDSWGVEIPPGIDATQGELYEVSDHGRLDLFEAQLIHFRQWMRDHGYQETRLALTEFGILMPNSYGFPPQAIADYLQQTFTWLYQAQDQSTGFPGDAYHLVQKWAWFSISDPNYPSSNLGDLATGELTLVGEEFRSILINEGE
jgi:hypothetical protein